jgi:hypothetical protein
MSVLSALSGKFDRHLAKCRSLLQKSYRALLKKFKLLIYMNKILNYGLAQNSLK